MNPPETDWRPDAEIVLHTGDALEFLKALPSDLLSLIITSPPYNVGKSYETRKPLTTYLSEMEPYAREMVSGLKIGGSLCWQTGNYIEDGEVFPLDLYFYPMFKRLGLKLRNRITWHYGHGLHATNRFSGRTETLLWFTKGDGYLFDLDAVRVPAKYPGKRHFKGPKKGQLSGNPLGKNPSDFWEFMQEEWDGRPWEIPQVKHNHPEKTAHPAQFPVELVERCILPLTRPGDWVMDPFGGSGTVAVAAVMHGRKTISVDRDPTYTAIASRRISMLRSGQLPIRPVGRPIHVPARQSVLK